IVPPERAARVAERLFRADMFCGWGVRTLSAENGGYNPLSYQRGSIWPMDNSLIALGLKRYGFWRETNRIAEGIFQASHYFADATLPELWAGFDRRAVAWPVLYPLANVPQAWSAGAIPLLLRAILGIEPEVGCRALHLRPTLPDWLNELTVRNLPFAGETLDLRFHGVGESSEVEVLRAPDGIRVVRDSPSLP
ncbi:MAG TPA: amylo-alpha-1,6-glucosidase, partial [Chloroflexota bacterium]|nr:amylo-alpha-1,6-glucosidase [Chloroflexota bacterium]